MPEHADHLPQLEETLIGTSLFARQDLEVSRHVFGGQVSYILRDPITFESHRFSKVDYEIFVAMATERPLGIVFDDVVARQLVDVSAKEEFYRFAANLVQLGLLGLPSPDGKTLYTRSRKRAQAARTNMLKNFLFQQIPLVNPDRFLDRTIHWARPLFSRWFGCVWAIGIVFSLAIITRRWTEFTDPVADLLTLKNAPMLWCILLGLKFVHEFGHAFACKHYGGNVPSMGVYLIAGNPCAFVDASAAWGIPNRMHRILVSLGGMYFESLVAIVAVLVWAFSTSPFLQSAAHHIVFMATAVTVLFNANPLMKYDGYFVACDLTGNPNLRQRANKELQQLLKRWVLGIGGTSSERLSARSLGLIAYGISSSIYKFFVVIGISSMVATKFAVLGLAMSTCYILSTLYGLYSSTLRYLWSSAEGRSVPGRANVCSALLLATVPLLLLVPIPTASRSTGRLTTSDEIEITNRVPGIVQAVLASRGQFVRFDQSLVMLHNQSLLLDTVDSQAQVQQALRTEAVQLQLDRTKAAKTSQQLEFLLKKSCHSDLQSESLAVVSDRPGVVMSCLPENRSGQFLPAGTTVAVIGSGPWQVRFLVDATTMLASDPQCGQVVSMRIRSQADKELGGTIMRIAEIGDAHVRDESLTQLAGGTIPVDPLSHAATKTYFEVVVELDEAAAEQVKLMHGMTVEVRMPRNTEIMAQLLYRRITKFINQVLTG